MIRSEIVDRMLLSVCAVERMEHRHEDLYGKVTPGDRVPRPPSAVRGTAFLVRHDLVLTNRHVVELFGKDAALGQADHWYLEFTVPVGPNEWSTLIKRVRTGFAIVDPSGGGAIDAGLLQFSRPEGEGLDCFAPVDFGELGAVRAGAEVGVCGFPLGNDLLMGPGLWRFGPLVHRGLISGVAPYHATDPRRITAFVTDLNSAGGMSGSPVFTPDDGKVIGLHYAGLQGTVGCAIPIDRVRVDGWVQLFERVLRGEMPTSIAIEGGGDVVF